MELKNVLSEGKFGTLTLKNRFIMPAMGTHMSDEQGFITQGLIDYHVERAKGGMALNITEFSSVHPTTAEAHLPGAYDDKYIPGLKKLVDAVHEVGGKICLQIWHAGRQTSSRITGRPIIGASPIPHVVYREMPLEMTKEQIKEIVEAYGDAAVRAKKAGFDAVELHGAHGYLLNQFMSAYSNKRTDEYGGSLENRTRFAVEVVKNIKEKVGKDFPLSYRITANEYVPEGLTIEDTVIAAKLLEEAGIDVIHVSNGLFERLQYTIAPIDVPVGFNVPNAEAIKKAVIIPVIAVGRINDPVYADKLVEEGKCDFVALGRASLADPEFVNKTIEGRIDDIIKCIGCNQGCVGGQCPDKDHVGPACLRNPSTGRESEYEIKPAEVKKKVLVIGGGAAGLEAATTLKRRGHEVVLCEKNSSLGGQFYLAGKAPTKGEMSEAALQMGRLAERAGVDIRLNTEVTRELILGINPDEVVIASGSKPVIPPIPGHNKENVVTAHEILSGNATAENTVAIIGGGLVGVETAELLTSQGKEVIIVEMLDQVAKELVHLRKIFALEFINKHNIKTYTDSKCVEIKENSIVIEKDAVNEEIKGIGTVVMAVGSRADNTMVEILKDMNYPYHVIGDALQARKAINAIWEAAAIGRAI
ncbi:FAD-dependent oxidoreductase [Alloiococcus sp. CFN-8]|uniref:oxidoreductase n=1 Tax=Alloiococcus sp. CFN-8 TaxID=3416081 RepID=UPI003CEA023F